MSKKPDGLKTTAPRRVHRELHPDYPQPYGMRTRLERAEEKQRLEVNKMLDRTIVAGKARAEARKEKGQTVNSGYRLTALIPKPAPGVSVRDFRMARQAAVRQQARMEGRSNLTKIRAR